MLETCVILWATASPLNVIIFLKRAVTWSRHQGLGVRMAARVSEFCPAHPAEESCGGRVCAHGHTRGLREETSGPSCEEAPPWSPVPLVVDNRAGQRGRRSGGPASRDRPACPRRKSQFPAETRLMGHRQPARASLHPTDAHPVEPSTGGAVPREQNLAAGLAGNTSTPVLPSSESCSQPVVNSPGSCGPWSPRGGGGGVSENLHYMQVQGSG